jgi:hypothetical protein
MTSKGRVDRNPRGFKANLRGYSPENSKLKKGLQQWAKKKNALTTEIDRSPKHEMKSSSPAKIASIFIPKDKFQLEVSSSVKLVDLRI